MSLLALALMLSTPAAEPPAPEMLTGPIKMKPSEIKAYNARLAPESPYYIRCQRQPVTGSLAKYTRVCRTNAEWTRIQTLGNEDARGFVDKANQGWTNGNPPGG